MKPGIRTTEFWATVAFNVGVVAAALASELPPRWAVVASSVSVVGYQLSRSITKNGNNGIGQ